MGVEWGYCGIMPLFMVLLCCSRLCSAIELLANQTASLAVNASPKSARKMPDKLFGIFFEEINHAGAGGLWAELVSNRGFEAGGSNTPSNIDPWSTIGDESNIFLSTDRSSCFIRNRVALRMEVRCDDRGTNRCPVGGVGVYNPGYWGMHIEDGKKYKVVIYVKSKDTANILVSLKSSDRLTYLAGDTIRTDASKTSDWTKVELLLESKGTNTNSRLEITTTKEGVYWLDQVSIMPADTYKGHGFRKDLGSMLENMKPQFLRFPGGSFVEGERLINAFRWRETVGPWEERPGHFNDVWKYWTDDGLGYFEFLQLAEDIGASPIWVINNGISHNDQVDSSDILPFVKDTLDSIEFARGNSRSKWGSVRTAMGHPDPFQLNLIAIGNQDCFKQNYRGNYLKFYSLIKAAYPDMKVITNCDASSQQLDHPADLYDIHVYTSASDMFSRVHQFDRLSRTGPKAFVSEYAVTGKDAGKGNLRAALAEAGFLIGLEKNSDAVELASCAPLFVNDNDRRFNPDAIVFNSWQQYGTPTYWMQHFFKESSGAIFHPSILQSTSASSLAASAITWLSSEDGRTYLRVKIVNFGNDFTNIEIVLTGLQNAINSFGSKKILLTSQNSMDENSFNEPTKVVPVSSMFPSAGTKMDVILLPHSLTALDLLLDSTSYRSAI
ncbi:alpha-L-arabinofuranosidase 1-like [Phalaenopsis equestris]|uniref:alpha-L-arabinofuranosidase 1-like n=1 Tax=Phalaenopsis equestris TaxID=78828 RepID=UPI0009E27787|nr:alpha-L-arabinofuranosidase 1-like [Phalaenopsis equestris]XP_020585443.1 alpha-L-arabinofuranosidase 1-like [Phalaenopsis equestris]